MIAFLCQGHINETIRGVPRVHLDMHSFDYAFLYSVVLRKSSFFRSIRHELFQGVCIASDESNMVKWFNWVICSMKLTNLEVMWRQRRLFLFNGNQFTIWVIPEWTHLPQWRKLCKTRNSYKRLNYSKELKVSLFTGLLRNNRHSGVCFNFVVNLRSFYCWE